MKSLLGKCYWVSSGKLMAGNYPLQQKHYSRKGEIVSNWDDSQLQALLGMEIRCFIDLTHENESLNEYGSILQGLSKALGFNSSYHRCQIVDESVPSSKGMTGILDIIDQAISSGNPAYVHCWGGRGRTGTVVGCWLARHNIAKGDAVLEKIAELRKQKDGLELPSPSVAVQKRFVAEWRE